MFNHPRNTNHPLHDSAMDALADATWEADRRTLLREREAGLHGFDTSSSGFGPLTDRVEMLAFVDPEVLAGPAPQPLRALTRWLGTALSRNAAHPQRVSGGSLVRPEGLAAAHR